MLPQEFRKVRLELAREPGQPTGDAGHGYDLLLPLAADGRIDVESWRAHRDQCRVRRFRRDEPDQIGVLSRKPGGRWFFDYSRQDDKDDEVGFHLEDERFTIGEYVSVREQDGKLHTFSVAEVEEP